MRTECHLLVSAMIAAVPLLYGQYLEAILCFLFGWLVDGDHAISYYLKYNHLTINPIVIFRAFNNYSPLTKEERYTLYSLAHGWEYFFVGILLGFPLLPLLAYLSHLILDVIGNNMYPQDMFIIIRFINKFRIKLRTRRNLQ